MAISLQSTRTNRRMERPMTMMNGVRNGEVRSVNGFGLHLRAASAVRVALLVVVTLCGTGSAVLAGADRAAGHLGLWREHILARGNLGGIELNSPDYEALVAMGPSCLPLVMEAYRAEQDPHVAYYYGMLIRRIAHFDFFRYSSTPKRIAGQEFLYEGEKPLLSFDVGDQALKGPAKALAMRDTMVAWWRQRGAFLQRDVRAEVKAAALRTGTQTDNEGASGFREFGKLAVYGIYNIPGYINIIRQDNDPIVFSEWLRITNHPEFQTLMLRGDLAENGRMSNARYPSVESKMRLVCSWWPENRSRFSGLTELQSGIDQSIQSACRGMELNAPAAGVAE